MSTRRLSPGPLFCIFKIKSKADEARPCPRPFIAQTPGPVMADLGRANTVYCMQRLHAAHCTLHALRYHRRVQVFSNLSGVILVLWLVKIAEGKILGGNIPGGKVLEGENSGGKEILGVDFRGSIFVL